MPIAIVLPETKKKLHILDQCVTTNVLILGMVLQSLIITEYFDSLLITVVEAFKVIKMSITIVGMHSFK